VYAPSETLLDYFADLIKQCFHLLSVTLLDMDAFRLS